MVAGYSTELVQQLSGDFVIRLTDLGTTTVVFTEALPIGRDRWPAESFAIEAQRSFVAECTEHDNDDVQLLGSFGDALMWVTADEGEDWQPMHERP